ARRSRSGPPPRRFASLWWTTFAWHRSGGGRRGRDSNPWKPFCFNGFQDRRLKPLGHLSARDRKCNLQPPPDNVVSYGPKEDIRQVWCPFVKRGPIGRVFTVRGFISKL